MDEEKRAAFKAKCAAGGRKCWEAKCAADRAAQIARINTPEVRRRASDANKARHRAKTEEERIAYSARHKARWLHPDAAVEEERRGRSERAKRQAAAWTPEQRDAFSEAGRKAHRKPVEGTPVGGTGEVVRFDSAGSAHLIATCFASSPYRARVIFKMGAFIRRRHVVRERAARHLRGPCRSPRNGVRVCVAARGERAVKFVPHNRRVFWYNTGSRKP